MPHPAASLLSWSDRQQVYELSVATHQDVLHLARETAAWFACLEEAPSFRFHGQRGSFTARKETKQRGSEYWYAYHKREGTLSKKYLGKTADLTFPLLEEIAGMLQAGRATPPRTAEAAPSFLAPSHTRFSDAGAEEGRVASPSRLPPSAPPTTQGDPLGTLLTAKLQQPRLRARLISRSHLVDRLEQGVAGALTLVSAPAGYGKTTLLAQWRTTTSTPVAWLSLEPEDNEPTQFLTYLISALQTLDRRLGVRAHSLLDFRRPAEAATVLASLSDDLSHWQEGDAVLVLDDYHVISAAPVHSALTYFVEHLPRHMHLILATRSDPPLPLARLRARGELTELRAAELCFGAAEAGAFLTEVMGLQLSQEEVVTLQARTEGWVAGLQLAALSLQGKADITRALRAFTGSHRFVLDYLSEEVLSHQTTEVQTFLLQTSILDRLSGSLCDAVTVSQDGQAMLETLDRANLFVVALDDIRGWYRYHHLFADLMRSRLQRVMPASLLELHQRASCWYEAHDLNLEAIRHAILAPDPARVIRLIEDHRHALVLRGQARMVLALLQTLPDELIQRHPSLCLSQGLLLTLTGQLPEALMRLQVAEQSASCITDEHEAQVFLHRVAALQAYILFFQGDLENSVALAEAALDDLAQSPMEVREGAGVIAAHSVLLSGEVRHDGEPQAARFSAPSSLQNDLLAMQRLLGLTAILLHARLLRLQGRLRQAAVIYEQMAQMAQMQGDHEETFIYPGACFGLGQLAYEWNNLDEAERLLEQGRDALRGSLTLAADAVLEGYATLARLYQTRGNHTDACALVDEFMRLAQTSQFAPAQQAIARAIRARLALMQGDVAGAARWADASGLSASADLSYPREQEYLIFARVRIAQGRLDPGGPFLAEALRLLERLRADAKAKARVSSLLEILVVQALALFASPAHRVQALPTLERALQLGEPERYVRLFVDEGESMVALLRQASTREITSDFVMALFAAFGEQTTPAPSHANPLIEPLTERELAVLRLLMTGLSNAEIARGLIITVGTVKRHVHSIYGKLGVQSRTQAVARAQALHVQ